jgi:hypothetical protein
VSAPTGPVLPAGFADLEHLAHWALPTEMARNRHRLSRPYEEIEAFYDAVLPRVGEIVGYLNGFDVTALPPAEHTLLNLLHALSDAAPCVEWWQEVTFTAGFDPRRITILQ